MFASLLRTLGLAFLGAGPDARAGPADPGTPTLGNGISLSKNNLSLDQVDPEHKIPIVLVLK